MDVRKGFLEALNYFQIQRFGAALTRFESLGRYIIDNEQRTASDDRVLSIVYYYLSMVHRIRGELVEAYYYICESEDLVKEYETEVSAYTVTIPRNHILLEKGIVLYEQGEHEHAISILSKIPEPTKDATESDGGNRRIQDRIKWKGNAYNLSRYYTYKIHKSRKEWDGALRSLLSIVRHASGGMKDKVLHKASLVYYYGKHDADSAIAILSSKNTAEFIHLKFAILSKLDDPTRFFAAVDRLVDNIEKEKASDRKSILEVKYEDAYKMIVDNLLLRGDSEGAYLFLSAIKEKCREVKRKELWKRLVSRYVRVMILRREYDDLGGYIKRDGANVDSLQAVISSFLVGKYDVLSVIEKIDGPIRVYLGGFASFKKKEYKLAVKLFKEYIASDEHDLRLTFNSYFFIGISLHRVGDSEGSFRSLSMALEYVPRLDPRTLNLFYLYNLHQKLAMHFLRKGELLVAEFHSVKSFDYMLRMRSTPGVRKSKKYLFKSFVLMSEILSRANRTDESQFFYSLAPGLEEIPKSSGEYYVRLSDMYGMIQPGTESEFDMGELASYVQRFLDAVSGGRDSAREQEREKDPGEGAKKIYMD